MTIALTGILGVAPLGSFEPGQSGATLAAVHWRCLLAVQAKLQSLTLAGLPASSIVVLKFPAARDYGKGRPGALPCVIVSPFGAETMNPAAGTNCRDDVGYPVAVSIVAAANADLSTNNLAQYLLWRQQIARALRNQPLGPLVPEVYTVFVEPLLVAGWDSFGHNLWNSSLTLRCMSREARGT